MPGYKLCEPLSSLTYFLCYKNIHYTNIKSLLTRVCLTGCIIHHCNIWFVITQYYEFRKRMRGEGWEHLYLSVCYVRSLQETGHQGRASRSCSQRTVAGSPRRSSPTGWASAGTLETVSPAARSPYSTDQYLMVILLRKALGWVEEGGGSCGFALSYEMLQDFFISTSSLQEAALMCCDKNYFKLSLVKDDM